MKEKILSAIGDGDILFIVSPFTTNSPSIGPHILQAIAQEKGYKTNILYLNLLLASIIGFRLSEQLGTSELFQYWGMLNERLFARSAYGLSPLGKSPEACANEALSISGSIEHHRKVDYDTNEIDLEQFWEIEEICKAFVDEIVQIIASLPYKIVGWTTRMGQTNCSIALINGIKRVRPSVITIIGGANCQSEMAEGIASLSKAIDYVFPGESEDAFNKFLDNYAQQQLLSERIIRGKPVEDLDTLPSLNYESYFRQFRQFLGEDAQDIPYIWHETSRGCWWGQKKKCRFCGRNNESLHFRQKSPQKVLQELRSIKQHYPNVALAMTDNIMPFSYYKDLLPLLGDKQEYPKICLYYVKANIRLKELLTLKQANVETIIPGMEALSTELLKLLNKGVTARNNLQLLRNSRSIGMNLYWFMLWGIPGDKAAYYEEILDILPLIRHFQPPTKLFCVHLERNSVYVEHPEEYNIKSLRPWAVYDMIYPQWANISKLAFFFVGEYPCEAYEHPELIQKLVDELVYWRKAWKTSKLAMIPFADYYIVYDSRNIPGTSKQHILEASQAQEIMTYCVYKESETQKWAVDHKLGVVVDSWYVPLVTAKPELLLEFEERHSNELRI